MQEFKITFTDHDKSVAVPHGTDLLSAATKAGIILNASCGGEGTCGKCLVNITSGKIKTDSSRFINIPGREKGIVLACQTIVESDLVVEIPKESVATHEHMSHWAEDFAKGVILQREGLFKPVPIINKIYLELSKPTVDDNTSDMDRIIDALKIRVNGLRLSTRLANLKHLSEVLRESDFKVTAVIAYKEGAMEILSFEPGDTTAISFAFAFDIGTTTVVGQLIDLVSGAILGTRIAFNKQSVYGADVITRIVFCLKAISKW